MNRGGIDKEEEAQAHVFITKKKYNELKRYRNLWRNLKEQRTRAHLVNNSSNNVNNIPRKLEPLKEDDELINIEDDAVNQDEPTVNKTDNLAVLKRDQLDGEGLTSQSDQTNIGSGDLIRKQQDTVLALTDGGRPLQDNVDDLEQANLADLREVGSKVISTPLGETPLQSLKSADSSTFGIKEQNVKSSQKFSDAHPWWFLGKLNN